MIYTVQSGDTVYSLSQRFGIPTSDIISINGLRNPDRLSVGQSLLLLKPTEIHNVTEGDTLYSIARMHHTSVDQLLRNNPYLRGKTDILPGQTVVINYEIPHGKRCLTVNGFVFPSIRKEVLDRTLPHLSHITPFAYGFESNGRLVTLPDDMIVQAARSRGVAPVTMLTNLNSEGKFDNSLSRLLLSDSQLQDVLIEGLIEAMSLKGSKILHVDFEYLFAEDKEAFGDFIEAIRSAFAPYGYEVWVSLAPKTSKDQEGHLYEGHDYSRLGSLADRVLLMTYEWGYHYGNRGAVAPVNSLRNVIDYALTEIPADKILLGVPNYGYDYQRLDAIGDSIPQTVSNQDAVELAYHKHASIEFDEAAAAPYFQYSENGTRHKVWFEDARSMDAVLQLVEEKGLSGISFWNLMDFFPQGVHSLLPYCLKQ